MGQEKLSIKGNIIKYDEESILKDVENILFSRFEFGDLDKGLNDLYDPYLLKDMDKAVNRIKEAKGKKERVIIFGDYDVDGVTSTSILMHFFKKIGLEASYRLPHRVKDGYGLKEYFIDELKDIGVTLIVTVDCGTRDIEVIKYAKNLGIDIIITDHHSVPDKISKEAIAFVNPKRIDCEYPFKELSGAGVALKLIMALSKEFLKEEEYKTYLKESIDIVAIGTVADCMPLTDENRIIVLEGLKQIKESRSLGIRKLIFDKINHNLDADIISFLLGPKLNVAGRLDTPYKAVNLILNNSSGVDEIIEEIESLNNKRKELTKYFFEDALEKINLEDNILFYSSKKIEHGIIGIIAGKLTETFHKPSIVFTQEEDKFVGSCRSPDYFSIIEYLEKYEKYFLHFGGHSQAAGLSISSLKFDDFKKEFTKELNLFDFKKEKKFVVVDKIIRVEEFSFNFLEKVDKFKPYGFGNEKPIFMFKDFEVSRVDYLGKTFEHITIKNNYGITLLGFNLGEYFEKLKSKKKMDIIFYLMEDIYLGKRQLKANIIDICVE